MTSRRVRPSPPGRGHEPVMSSTKLVRRLTAFFPAAALLLAIPSCDEGKDSEIPDSAEPAVENYAAIVAASYEDSLTSAVALQQAVHAFLAAPSQAGLDASKNAWLASREPYLQTEVYRFYDGPIDHPETGPEGMINAWPLDEAYIDYVAGNATAGIVNDPNVVIDAATLMALNEQGGEANIATGFHAIEFLLWGQDMDVAGPGNRPYTDYVVGGAAANADRRGQYLRVVSDLLVQHLTDMRDAWAAGAANYRADFVAAGPEESLRRILTGMIVLSGFETGGERLQAALDSGDQEDEHSCFSDNTHRDMIQDIAGISNVWHGRYGAVSGTGVREVVADRDADLAAALDAKIDESLALANALGVPFDQEIAVSNPAGRARVAALVLALNEQDALLQDVFRLFELEIPQPE
ncbi:MAG: iron-regulated protein [Myxococcales bacterium FL481]|nr:MAG: iron-regulated protein [Myxococcales bacterium FL481]